MLTHIALTKAFFATSLAFALSVGLTVEGAILFVQESHPGDLLEREAIRKCERVDPDFVRYNPSDRMACYARFLAPAPDSEASAAGALPAPTPPVVLADPRHKRTSGAHR